MKILQFSIDDLIADPDSVAAGLNQACRRAPGQWRVSGLCQTDHQVLLQLEEGRPDDRFEYVLAPFDGLSGDAIAGELFSRWQGGFATRGMVRLNDQYLGLFEKPRP